MKCSNLVRGVLCCLFLFAATTLHAQSSPSLVEAAKKEGKLVYYTVLTASREPGPGDGLRKKISLHQN